MLISFKTTVHGFMTSEGSTYSCPEQIATYANQYPHFKCGKISENNDLNVNDKSFFRC